MSTLDDFFKQTADVPLHPRLREWKRRKDEGADLRLELYRPGSAMGLTQAELYILDRKNGDSAPIDTLTWDEDINAGLVQLKVRAVDSSQEAKRFALALRGALRKVSREFGDGYFNAVLLALIKESDLTQHAEIQEVVKYTYGNAPEPSRSFAICREMIADAIGARAGELRLDLQYSEEEAKSILTKAIAQYLDERFSVSSRRRMGLL